MSQSQRRAIVTGGAGFIGSYIARRLLREGWKVWVVDNLSTGSAANIPAGAEIVEMDISNAGSYIKMPRERVDAVLHLAAQSSGEISDERPELDLRSNSLGTLLMLLWCKENRVPRFLYASSMGVYGNAKVLPVSEDHVCQPISCYGNSKLAAENYIRIFSGKGISATIFRIFSAYGPGQDLLNLKQGMVSIYMHFLLKDEPIVVKGSFERFRDLTYVDDIVDAWLKALDSEKAVGRTYNLATGKKTTVRELVEEEIRAFGRNPETYPVQGVGATPNDQFGLFADVGRIRADLGWAPKVSLSEGLARMVTWAREQSERDLPTGAGKGE